MTKVAFANASGSRRWLATLAVGGVAALAAVGCGGSSGNESSSSDNRLIIGVAALPVTLDAMFAPGQESVEAIGNLYDNLLCYRTVQDEGFEAADIGAGEDAMEPCLIDDIEVSNDGATYTLHVRPDVKAADGDVLTAQDVKWSFDRAFGTKAVGAYIMGVAGIGSPDDVTVVDDATVQIKLKGPNPIFKRVLNVHTNSPWNESVVKEHAGADDPWATEWLKTNAAGFGPYTLGEATSTQLTFKANPKYWGPKPAYKTVIYRQIPDSSQRLSLLKAGEIDVAEGLSVQQTDSLDGAENVTPINTVKNQIIYAAINGAKGPLGDAKVREALNYLVPADQISKTVYGGNAKQLKNMVPADYPGFDESLSSVTYDPEKAKSLLSAAGQSNLSLTMTINGDIPEHSDVAVIIRDAFAKAGVQLSIQKKPTAAYLAAAQSGSTELWLQQSYSIVADIAYHYATYVAKTGPLAYDDFSDPEFDELLAKSSATPAGPERDGQLKRLQEIVAEQSPQLSIASVPTTYGIAADVKGYTWYTNNQLRFDRFHP